MTTDKKLMLFAITLIIFLIMPISFANDNYASDEIRSIIIDNTQDNIEPDDTPLEADANAVYVDASSGRGEGNGSADSPASTIEEGLNLVGNDGTIYLSGRFSGEGNCNLTLDTIRKITFVGRDGATVDGNFTNTFASISKGEYYFEKISFINHYKNDTEAFGAVFYNSEGTLTFKDCIFENNAISGVNKAHGGVLDNEGTVTFINCTFKNNTATVTNSSAFRKNSADGGALSSIGTLNVYNSSFIENRAMRNGGAIRTQDGSKTLIDGCNFTGNVAAYHMSGGSYGGAIYTWDCGLELYNSVFKDNSIYDASGYGARGGALSLNRGIGKIIIYSCQFINNTAGGVATVDGQSIYFDSVEATVNYCTIDTSIYSISQTVNLNYNWWAVNDSDIYSLIETLPSSAAIKTYTEAVISSDIENPEIGESVNVFINLYWNGTVSSDNISMLPLRHVSLESRGGNLSEKEGWLEKGMFKTQFTPSEEDIMIIANVNGVVITSNLADGSPDFEIITSNITEGEKSSVEVHINNTKVQFALIEIDDLTYYCKITEGKFHMEIPGLESGKHDVNVRFYDKNFNLISEGNSSLRVDEKIPETVSTNVTLEAAKSISMPANDISAGESGGYITATLKDTSGNALTNKTVQIAVNGNIYSVITDSEGRANLQVNYTSAGTYYYVIAFNGNSNYAPSGILSGKLSVTKKAASISASSKTFKAASKTKSLSVTLKTSKNKFNGKTYLSKGKKITLKVNKKKYTVKINAKGVAKFNVKITKKGKYTAVIKFAGDSTYKSVSKKIKINIK